MGRTYTSQPLGSSTSSFTGAVRPPNDILAGTMSVCSGQNRCSIALCAKNCTPVHLWNCSIVCFHFKTALKHAGKPTSGILYLSEISRNVTFGDLKSVSVDLSRERERERDGQTVPAEKQRNKSTERKTDVHRTEGGREGKRGRERERERERERLLVEKQTQREVDIEKNGRTPQRGREKEREHAKLEDSALHKHVTY